jgi:hypothetical protein
LRESLRIKSSLSSSLDVTESHPAEPDSVLADLFGIERSIGGVSAARSLGFNIAQADFFDVEPGEPLGAFTLPLQFDAIIGNPPYIRQEIMGAAEKESIRARMHSDRRVNGLKWSGRSDAYVYFFARAVRFLKQEGRLAFLTASSWLDVGYGEALRSFLVDNFRIIAIIESDAESFFEDASINTVITVLEPEPDEDTRKKNQVRFVQLQAPLSGLLDKPPDSGDPAIELARAIERHSGSAANDGYRVKVMAQSRLLQQEIDRSGTPVLPGLNLHAIDPPAKPVRGWGMHLRADDVLFEIITRGSERLTRLSEMASVRFGVKTGANEFFYVSRQPGVMKRLAEIASVRRGVTTGANEFFYLRSSGNGQADNQTIEVVDTTGARRLIEIVHLTPVIFSLKEIPCIRLNADNARRFLFNCSAPVSELQNTLALDYIRLGEEAGYHTRPTCASRDPWYAVLKGRSPAPLLFPSKVGERWLVALNDAELLEDKKLYGVSPSKGVSTRLLAALLNSTWARYYAEMTCRQMTGSQAIADIDVAVAEQILLPDPRSISERLAASLQEALDSMAGRAIVSVFEEVTLADRRRLDLLVLEAIGFEEPGERESVLDRLYVAVTGLVRSRLARSKPAAKTKRSQER